MEALRKPWKIQAKEAKLHGLAVSFYCVFQWSRFLSFPLTRPKRGGGYGCSPPTTRVICCFTFQSKAPSGKTPRKISHPYSKYKRKFTIIGKPNGTKSEIENMVRTNSYLTYGTKPPPLIMRIRCGRILASAHCAQFVIGGLED